MAGREIAFCKMQALGNDFVVVDARNGEAPLSPEDIRRLADRRLGVGCDQVLILRPPGASETNAPDADAPAPDARLEIFNADGGPAEQCGNGVRCIGRYLADGNPAGPKSRSIVSCAGGQVELFAQQGGEVRANMGTPSFDPARIPMTTPPATGPAAKPGDGEAHEARTPAGRFRFTALSLGNPHAVIRVADVRAAPVAEAGAALGGDPRFPRGVNVGFMQVLDRRHVLLRVYERGAGETPACGTGACAAAVAGRYNRWLDDDVQVQFPEGALRVEWPGAEHGVWMTGPADLVFKGRIEL